MDRNAIGLQSSPIGRPIGLLGSDRIAQNSKPTPVWAATPVTKPPTCAQLQLWECRVWCLSGRARAVCCVLRATDRSNCRSIGAPIEQSAIPIHAQNLGTLTIDMLCCKGDCTSMACTTTFNVNSDACGPAMQCFDLFCARFAVSDASCPMHGTAGVCAHDKDRRPARMVQGQRHQLYTHCAQLCRQVRDISRAQPARVGPQARHTRGWNPEPCAAHGRWRSGRHHCHEFNVPLGHGARALDMPGGRDSSAVSRHNSRLPRDHCKGMHQVHNLVVSSKRACFHALHSTASNTCGAVSSYECACSHDGLLHASCQKRCTASCVQVHAHRGLHPSIAKWVHVCRKACLHCTGAGCRL